MNEQSYLNKKAWEHKAYDFWIKRDGTPEEKAKKIMEDPISCLKNHSSEFVDCKDLKIANICGSNGRKAVPLALLGANVTVFDISEENHKYALELANCAGVRISYEVGDVYDIDTEKYNDYFDVIYLEGGVLHYFNNIEKLMDLLSKLLRYDGKMILSDFHPIRKIMDTQIAERTMGDYFETELHRDDIAYKKYYDTEREAFPDVVLRYYTLSEIINSILKAEFAIHKFNEHPDHINKKIPGEFTIIAKRLATKNIDDN